MRGKPNACSVKSNEGKCLLKPLFSIADLESGLFMQRQSQMVCRERAQSLVLQSNPNRSVIECLVVGMQELLCSLPSALCWGEPAHGQCGCVKWRGSSTAIKRNCTVWRKSLEFGMFCCWAVRRGAISTLGARFVALWSRTSEARVTLLLVPLDWACRKTWNLGCLVKDLILKSTSV